MPATADQAIQLLLSRFPTIVKHVSSADELFEMGAYYAYERFSDEVRSRAFDEQFIADACTFINELLDSDDTNFDDWVHLSVLESLAGDVTVLARVRNCLNSKAREKLKVIEREVYGRG